MREAPYRAPAKPPQFPNYRSGTYGPKAADDLLRNDGRTWINGG